MPQTGGLPQWEVLKVPIHRERRVRKSVVNAAHHEGSCLNALWIGHEVGEVDMIVGDIEGPLGKAKGGPSARVAWRNLYRNVLP